MPKCVQILVNFTLSYTGIK